VIGSQQFPIPDTHYSSAIPDTSNSSNSRHPLFIGDPQQFQTPNIHRRSQTPAGHREHAAIPDTRFHRDPRHPLSSGIPDTRFHREHGRSQTPTIPEHAPIRDTHYSSSEIRARFQTPKIRARFQTPIIRSGVVAIPSTCSRSKTPHNSSRRRSGLLTSSARLILLSTDESATSASGSHRHARLPSWPDRAQR
jgi:hypothetical protein